ncbi:MAG: 30S ribosomal protein S16 [Holosporales bacterium]|jgi:small subunit ribosomal protein S16|nr:30S ribosomal protein S16 [Holosporales bacterium]
MALKIRLARGGAKKRPFYRVVVAEATSPRDGRFIERIGSYNPLLEKDHADRLVLRADRAKYWLSVGAKATEKVQKLLAEMGVIEKFVPPERPKKSAPKKKAQEKMKAAS